MAWEEIENCKPLPLDALPPAGIKVRARVMGKKAGGHSRYISIQIGKDLARKMHLTLALHRLRLLFGTEAEAGQIGLAVDQERGKFAAKRSKQGDYTLTITAAVAEGLFALEFPTFCVIDVAVQCPPNAPKVAVFAASEAMLAAD